MFRLAIAVSCFLAVFASPILDNALNEHWDLYKATHNKNYQTKEEETLRFELLQFSFFSVNMCKEYFLFTKFVSNRLI